VESGVAGSGRLSSVWACSAYAVVRTSSTETSDGLLGLGCGETAPGGLDVADLLRQRSLRQRLAADAFPHQRHLEVVLQDADLEAGCAAGLRGWRG
jgi:hypothetical protein